MAVDKGKSPDNTAAEAEGQKPANIAPATGIDPSGAPHQVVPDVDLGHPAVDANPRAKTTVDQNKIDWNAPSAPSADVVAKALTEQGVPTTSD